MLRRAPRGALEDTGVAMVQGARDGLSYRTRHCCLPGASLKISEICKTGEVVGFAPPGSVVMSVSPQGPERLWHEAVNVESSSNVDV